MWCDWRGYPEETSQGHCPNCNAITFPFYLKWTGKTFLGRTKKDFKNVLGYSMDCRKKDNIILLLECPKCFEKSYFHVPTYWIEDYGKWLKEFGEASDEK